MARPERFERPTLQSLVVWSIREGRQYAHMIDRFLMGSSTLSL
jgi:NADPH-dependent glutamate synthase beta subunit-like oxidoreductase